CQHRDRRDDRASEQQPTGPTPCFWWPDAAFSFLAHNGMLMHRDSSGPFVDRLRARAAWPAMAHRVWRRMGPLIWGILVWWLTTVAFTGRVRAESVSASRAGQGGLTIEPAPRLTQWTGLP